MEKKIVPLLCSTALLATALAGCSGGNDEKESAAGNSPAASASADQALKEIPLPITKEPMTINYWRANDPKITASQKGFGDMAAYKKKEELTGIKVNWTHPPLGQQRDQFNLLMATNKLPDIIYYNWNDAIGGPEKMLTDNRIVKLNDYIDKYAPNFKKMLEKDPELKKQVALGDGTIYAFPYMRSDATKLNATVGFVIRKDWLDKLGLKAPTTIDEWYTVLKAFKEKDPNGNGKADELPFTGNWGPGNMSKLYEFTPGFGFLSGYYLKDGKVTHGTLQPEYKTFLETMAKWYKEGLIDPEIMTNDGKAFDFKVTNNLAGSYREGIFGGLGKYMGLMKDTNPQFNLTGVAWPKAPNGKTFGTVSLNGKVIAGYGEAITSSVPKEKIPYLVQWMDFNYSPQGSDLFNFGIEGESYTKSGDKITFTDTILKNPKLTYDQALASYAMSIMDGPMNQDGRYLDALMMHEGQKEANKVWMQVDNSLHLPFFRFTEAEAKSFNTINNEINTFINEGMTKFIMGAAPFTEYDKFVQTIKNMGIEKAIKLHEDALARYK